MPAYQYIAIDSKGKKVKGSISSESSFTLATDLRNRSLTIISAEEIQSRKKKGNKLRPNSFFSLHKKIPTDQILVFFRQLSTMVDAGVPLVDSLAVLHEQAEHPRFKLVIEQVKTSVEAGNNFSAALSKFPEIFPRLGVSMIKAAEVGGNLGNILSQLADYIENQDKIDKKIKSAASYPRFILIFFAIVVSAVIYGLVPKFQDIFESLGATLPGPTLAIIAVSNFAKNNLLYEVIFIVLLIIGLQLMVKQPWGRLFIDRLKLKLPILGEISVKSTIARFCKTLGTLTKNGVPLVDALSIASETANNVVVQHMVADVKNKVSSGASLAESMKAHAIFPMMVVKMVAVGEESGALEMMLNKVSEFYESQFNSKIESLTSIIEPVLMIGLGLLATVIVIALYLPIFQLSGAITG